MKWNDHILVYGGVEWCMCFVRQRSLCIEFIMQKFISKRQYINKTWHVDEVMCVDGNWEWIYYRVRSIKCWYIYIYLRYKRSGKNAQERFYSKMVANVEGVRRIFNFPIELFKITNNSPRILGWGSWFSATPSWQTRNAKRQNRTADTSRPNSFACD